MADERRDAGDNGEQQDTGPFTPRPEAKAYRWKELTESNKKATRELLRWLQTAAQRTSSKGDDCLATSVLIAGDRGTGKTTVLLTAAQAIRDGEKEEAKRFESNMPEGEDRQIIHEALTAIRSHVEWLDRLDLEPIPKTANLLTTLLVCVRAALEKAYGLKAGEEKLPSSLLDEGDESPWDAIDQLIRDATYMWEEMQAPDLERRVTLQMKAAETYAAFQDRLKDALDKVIKALQTRRFGQGVKDPLIMVLPMDNVDRSVDHIASIRKLLRMVPGRRLWFVLAAGGGDFQLFLERAFYTELNRDERTVMSGQSWDDARTIARRQAAGAMREVIPPIHRIDLDLVTPEEAWWWSIPENGASKPPLTLGKLLDEIRFRVKSAAKPAEGSTAESAKGSTAESAKGSTAESAKGSTTEPAKGSTAESAKGSTTEPAKGSTTEPAKGSTTEPAKGSTTEPVEGSTAKSTNEDTRFSRLFALNTWLSTEAREAIRDIMQRQKSSGAPVSKRFAPPGTRREKDPIFSDAGRSALTLPIRRLLDLYLLLRRYQPTGGASANLPEIDPAVQVAEKMLRNCIDESDLPDRISKLLREEIIAKDANDRTVLHSEKVAWSRPASAFAEFTRHHHPTVQKPEASHPNPKVSRTTIELRWPGELRLYITDPEERKSRRLPSSVAGWYMVLHDLLAFAPEPRIYTFDREPGSQPLVVTRHTIESLYRPTEIALPWPEPEWESFLGRSTAASQWRGRLHRIEDAFISSDWENEDPTTDFERLARLLRAAWAANIYEVTMYAEATKPEEVTKLGGTISRGGWRTGTDESSVLDFEKWIREYILSLHVQCLHKASDVKERELFSFTEDRFSRTHTWIDTCLPLLFRGEFVPARVGKESISHLGSDGKTLGEHWRDRASFLEGRLATRVIEAVQESDTYKSLKGDIEKADLWVWLRSACQACFEIGSEFHPAESETFMPSLKPESRWPK